MSYNARVKALQRRAGGIYGYNRGWEVGSNQSNAIGIPHQLVRNISERTTPINYNINGVKNDDQNLVVIQNTLSGVGRHRSQFNHNNQQCCLKPKRYYLDEKNERSGLKLTAALLTGHGASHDIVGFVGSELHTLGPDYNVVGSLIPSGAHGTEILGVYTHDLPPSPHVPPQQIHIGISGEVPTSFTFTGGDLAQPYTLKTADAHFTPDPPSPAVWPWLNQGFYFTIGQTYTIFLNY